MALLPLSTAFYSFPDFEHGHIRHDSALHLDYLPITILTFLLSTNSLGRWVCFSFAVFKAHVYLFEGGEDG
jgi:hypothetical protein